ncbi:hypothetical protein DVS77_21530 [Mycolicibacterium moriokaense]|nr:hypothetical protein DVS77_21530 [Mycolicibacterium moriokaense]
MSIELKMAGLMGTYPAVITAPAFEADLAIKTLAAGAESHLAINDSRLDTRSRLPSRWINAIVIHISNNFASTLAITPHLMRDFSGDDIRQRLSLFSRQMPQHIL